MAEMGHTSPTLALWVYAQAMRRGEAEQKAMRALLEGGQLAVIGNRGENDAVTTSEQHAA
jgi:hypothetical protein